MKNQNSFNKEGQWFKGNLHCHTTNSDGRLSPASVVDIYKENGWNFLALTDHRLYTYLKEFNDENFIIIPGVELDNLNPSPHRNYHIVGIGKGPCGDENGFEHGYAFERTQWEGLKTAQELIDSLTSKNNLAILAHPNWSRMELSDFIDLDGFFAMELYNNGCELENRTGLCIDYWDSLLRRGRKVYGVATDDAHHKLDDQCGGWVMVKSSTLSPKSIATSLMEGSFYSSTGPEIYEFSITDGEAYVSCSDVHAIHFVSYESLGHSFWGEGDSTINSARYKLNSSANYVRVECIDNNGKTAWSNPIFLQE